ncbi:hypothetical protein [Ruminococcus sp.]|jgi:hypothetical protein|uniref:hypothetical protein n=1 Tax=Ruminococcus sp. TaxID=41978 RepID=UPI0025DDF192|nr:hypothetical protein [Ruminococcus sp.]
MIVLIKETARFIKDNSKTPDSLCCAEALYGIINGSMSEATAISAISSKLLKKVWIYDNVPNCATAFVVTTIKLLRDILVAQHYWIAQDIADLLIAMPSKEKLSDRNAVFDFNAVSIRSFNQKYPFRIPDIVI